MPSIYTARSTLFIVFVIGVAACSSIVSTPYYLENGIDIQKISVITSHYFVVFILVDMISSYFFDKISKRLSIFLCLLVSTVSFFITGYAHAPHFFSMILIATLFRSAGNAFSSGASTALVLEEVDDKKNIKANMAKLTIACSTASIIGYCMGLIATQFLAYKTIIYIVGTSVLVLCPFTMIFLPKNKHKDAFEFSLKTIKKDMKYAYLVMFGKKRYALTFYSLILATTASTLSLYALYLLNPNNAVTIVFIRMMAMHVLGIINSKINMHVKSKTMLLISLILAGITTLCVIYYFHITGSRHEQFVLLSIMLVCFSAAYYGLFPISTYFQRRISHRMRSTIISYRTSFSMLVQGILLPLLGFLYSKYEHVTLLFLSLAFTITALLLLCNTRNLLTK